jgi:hypothetical protein
MFKFWGKGQVGNPPCGWIFFLEDRVGELTQHIRHYSSWWHFSLNFGNSKVYVWIAKNHDYLVDLLQCLLKQNWQRIDAQTNSEIH